MARCAIRVKLPRNPGLIRLPLFPRCLGENTCFHELLL